VPQRADDLMLSCGRDAGPWEKMSALSDAGLLCYVSMCEKEEIAANSSGATGDFFLFRKKENGFGI